MNKPERRRFLRDEMAGHADGHDLLPGTGLRPGICRREPAGDWRAIRPGKFMPPIFA